MVWVSLDPPDFSADTCDPQNPLMKEAYIQHCVEVSVSLLFGLSALCPACALFIRICECFTFYKEG